jgi:hypothetical protein
LLSLERLDSLLRICCEEHSLASILLTHPEGSLDIVGHGHATLGATRWRLASGVRASVPHPHVDGDVGRAETHPEAGLARHADEK